jgi:hypothetical protein
MTTPFDVFQQGIVRQDMGMYVKENVCNVYRPASDDE